MARAVGLRGTLALRGGVVVRLRDPTPDTLVEAEAEAVVLAEGDRLGEAVLVPVLVRHSVAGPGAVGEEDMLGEPEAKVREGVPVGQAEAELVGARVEDTVPLGELQLYVKGPQVYVCAHSRKTAWQAKARYKAQSSRDAVQLRGS